MESYFEKLPITENDTILDIGCGTGEIALALSKRAKHVIGVDNNMDVINHANDNNKSKNVDFLNTNIVEMSKSDLPYVDGIWSSFSAAYFTDFQTILAHWSQFLKPGGWIALVEIDNLLAHTPMENKFRISIYEFYKVQLRNGVYDYKMGRKLNKSLTDSNYSIQFEEHRNDLELVFEKASTPEIQRAWESRLNRLESLQDYLGNEQFHQFQSQFIQTIRNDNHKTDTKIHFIVGTNNIHSKIKGI